MNLHDKNFKTARTYNEKREHYRMHIDTNFIIKCYDSDTKHKAICKNLSANGILFEIDSFFAPKTELEILLESQSVNLNSKFNAKIIVIRSDQSINSGLSCFLTAAKISKIL